MLNKQIEKYKISKLIGEGGMAKVYEAEHIRLGNKVAIKILDELLVSKSNIRQRFENEAKIMAGLKHKNIVKVIDFIEDGNTLAIIMELMEGQSLSAFIKQKGKLNKNEALHIFKQVLEAFDFAHQKGVIHRDIKPSNIFIETDENNFVKILDFGIAKLVSANSNLTGTGTQMGTPIFMSPEQVKDTKYIDNLSDIYSLGVVLYYILNGGSPYDTSTLSKFDIFNKIVRDPLEELKDFPELNAIIQKATAKEAKNRFMTCGAFYNAINTNYKEESNFQIKKTNTNSWQGLLIKKGGNNKYGFVNSNNKVVVSYVYDKAFSFSEGYAKVMQNNKYGFIDIEGNVVIPFVYNNAKSFSEGVVAVQKEVKTGFISKEQKWGFVNSKHETIIPFIYEEVGSFSEGLVAVIKDYKAGFINKENSIIIPFIYTEGRRFINGLAIVRNSYFRYGFINKNAEVVIPIIYRNIEEFSEGLAMATKLIDDGFFSVLSLNCGYINKQGVEIIPFVYDSAGSFRNGVAIVKKDHKYGIINTKAQEITEFKYNLIKPFTEELAVASKSVKGTFSFKIFDQVKFGFLNTKGEEAIPLEYDNVFPFEEGKAKVIKNRKTFFINKNNEIVQ